MLNDRRSQPWDYLFTWPERDLLRAVLTGTGGHPSARWDSWATWPRWTGGPSFETQKNSNLSVQTPFSDTTASSKRKEICRHSLDSSCACVLSGILGISLQRGEKSMWNKRKKEVVGRDGIDLMLTVDRFNDYKSCINLHLPNSFLSSTNQLTYRNWQSKGYCWFYPHLGTLKTIGGFCCAVLFTLLATKRMENKQKPPPLIILFWEQHFQIAFLIWSIIKNGGLGAGLIGLDRPSSSELHDRSESHHMTGLKTFQPGLLDSALSPQRPWDHQLHLWLRFGL